MQGRGGHRVYPRKHEPPLNAVNAVLVGFCLDFQGPDALLCIRLGVLRPFPEVTGPGIQQGANMDTTQ